MDKDRPIIVVAKDGQLFVEEMRVDSQRPLRVKVYFATGIAERDNPWLVGKALRYWHDGCYFVIDASREFRIYLPQDGQAKPAWEEEEPIRAPGRGGKRWQWAWRYGRWVREAKEPVAGLD